MKYSEFENVIATPRINRYYLACVANTRKAMTLYRLNLRLSQEMFTLISCLEVAMRNAIDKHYLATLGNDWLRDAARPAGIFDNPRCIVAANTINEIVTKLNRNYAHPKVVAELGFGFWRYLFSPHQYRAGRQTLINIFRALPASTPAMAYNANFIFNELAKINKIRNRIAHHEAICFTPRLSVKDTTYARQHYALILQLFQWMSIDEAALLFGLDHVNTICNQIDAL